MAKTGLRGRLGGALGGVGSLLPRLNTKALLEASTLGLVLVLAVVFRMIKIRWGPYMDAYDPLFQLRVTEYVVKNGYAAWFTWHDTLSWYPMGRNIAHSSYPGVPFSAAFAYQVLHLLGLRVSVFDVCLFFPVFMGAVTCIVVYFLGKEIGGSAVGLFSAFFMAVSEAFISRTALGFFDTENIGIFGMALVSFLFLRSIDDERPTWERTSYSVVAGLSLAYTFASWGAARFIVGLLTVFVLASFLIGLYKRNYLASFVITLAIGLSLGSLVPKLGTDFVLRMDNVLAIFVALSLVFYEALKQRIEGRRLLLLFGALVVILVIGAVALSSLGLVSRLESKFWRVIFPGEAEANSLYASVAEHKRSVWTDFFGKFGLTFALGVLGTYFALNELNGKKLLGALFFATGVYFAGSMSRLALILSAPAAVMASFGLKELLAPFVNLSRGKRGDRRERRRRTVFGVSREFALLFSLFIFVAALPTFWSTAESSNAPTQLSCSSVYGILAGDFPKDWLQALQWMRDNLRDDAIVVSWWDYGYWIEALANKTTLADGATWNGTSIANIGRIMMFNQSGSIPLLKRYNATHIVVFNAVNPNNPEQAIGHGDNTKWTWMVQIPGLNLTDYYDDTGPKAKYRESTLYRLMNRQPDTAFKLVFSSQFNFVLVYKIDYGASYT
ncbi:MAG: glycosyltransferase family 39 protein [Candidatus Bathyarchaeota archaeon]|nr:glycosyltransferase family 39 protein [Candidatus Bathyarchaeota archaeon]